MNKILVRKIRIVLCLVKPEIICKYDSLYYFNLYMEREFRAFCKEHRVFCDIKQPIIIDGSKPFILDSIPDALIDGLVAAASKLNKGTCYDNPRGWKKQ